MTNRILLLKRIACAAGVALLMAGSANASVIIDITEANAAGATASVGTLAAITEPADMTALTSLSYTVSGVDIDGDMVNDTATFTIPISAVGGGTINWDNQVAPGVSEFDYSNSTFGGTNEGITFGAITVSGTGSLGQGYTLTSADYTEWTVRRWGASDTQTVVGDVTGTQNLVNPTNPANTTLNDTTFTATAGDGTWNGLNVDFRVHVSSAAVPEPSSLALVAAGLGMIGLRRRRLN